jgi:hypothetical protein
MNEKNNILNSILEEVKNNQGISSSTLYFKIESNLNKLNLPRSYNYPQYLHILIKSGFVQVLYDLGSSGYIVYSIRSGPLSEIDFHEYQKRKKYYTKIGKRFLVSNSIISSNDAYWFFRYGEDYFEFRKKRNAYLATLSEEKRKYEIDLDKFIKIEERSGRTERKFRELIWWRKKNKIFKVILTILIAGCIVFSLSILFALGSLILYFLPIIAIGYFIYLLLE